LSQTVKDVVERGVPELLDAFRAMAGNVDADLAHHSDGFGPYGSRRRACAFHRESLASIVPE